MKKRFHGDPFGMEDDHEKWEPRSVREWIEQDPFEAAGVPIKQTHWELAYESAFRAWQHLPLPYRRQVWREREIAADLYVLAREWQIEGMSFVSVGKRQVGGKRRLVGVVSVEIDLPQDPDLINEYFHVPRAIKIGSRIDDYYSDDEVIVPVRLEYQPRPSLLSVSLVPPGQFIATSDVLPLPISVPTLQAGQIVMGESPAGLRKPGTLGAIISRDADTAPLILSAAHVLGDIGWSVVANVPMPVEVGKVIRVDQNLDAAIAEITKPWMVDFRLKDLSVVPAAPIFPFSDMPVQFIGGTSGHQQGWINSVNNIPVGGRSVGVIPHFTSDVRSQPGDSGALLITSHGKASPFPAAFARTMHPQYLEATTCAMLGMIVAGPSSTLSPASRPLTYITPILSILDDFRLQAWVRSI